MGNLPRHVAIIMDGNGRWAQRDGLPRLAGHRAGLTAARKIIRYAAKCQIGYITLFAFGIENWRRPTDEVAGLMSLFLTALQREVPQLHQNNIKFRVLGDVAGFKDKIRKNILKYEKLTADNTGMQLNIAANYSGQWDITQAVQKIAKCVAAGELSSSDINSDLLAKNLVTNDIPCPDLFIRTSGEMRLSNFLLWDMAYTELYFTDVLWPDFSEECFEDALTFYAKRNRRFGHTTEQIKEINRA